MTDTVLADLRGQLDELDGLVEPLDDARWDQPSACPGWTISDVVLHLAQTNEMAAASARGTLMEAARSWTRAEGETVDELAAAAVADERGAAPAEVHARWRAGADDMIEAFSACRPEDRVLWAVGDMAARSLATTRVAETLIHTEDIAEGLGIDLAGTARLRQVVWLLHSTLPYAFERAGEPAPGAIAFTLRSPTGDETWAFGEPTAPTTVTGPALDLCRVAGQRRAAASTGLVGRGPDADGVLALMRTFA